MTALPPGWATVAQTARHFHVSRATVYRRVKAGEWPSSVLPGMRHRRFSPDDLAAIAAMATPVDVAA